MGRVKIEIKYLESRSNRSATFRKRSNGLLKKARELHVLCGAAVELLMIGEDGRQNRYSSSADDVQSYGVGIGVSNCLLQSGEDDEDDTSQYYGQQQQQQQQQQTVIVNQDGGAGGGVMSQIDFHMLQHVQMLKQIGGVQYCQEGIYQGMQHLESNTVHGDGSIGIEDYLQPALTMEANQEDGYVSNPAEAHSQHDNDTVDFSVNFHGGLLDNQTEADSGHSSMNFLDNQPKPTTRKRSLTAKRRKMSCNDNTNQGVIAECSCLAVPVKYELEDGSLRYFSMPDEEDMSKFLLGGSN